MKKTHQIILGILVLGILLWYFDLLPFGLIACEIGVMENGGLRPPGASRIGLLKPIGYMSAGSEIVVDNTIWRCSSRTASFEMVRHFDQTPFYSPMYSPDCDRAGREEYVFPSMSNKWCYHPKSQCLSYRIEENADCPVISSGQTITRVNGDVYRMGDLDPSKYSRDNPIPMQRYTLTSWVKIETIPVPEVISLFAKLSQMWNDFITYLTQIWESLKFFAIIASYNIGDTFTMMSTSTYITPAPVIDEDYTDGTITRLYARWVVMKNGIKIDEAPIWIQLNQQTFTKTYQYTCVDNAKVVLSTAIFQAKNTYDMSAKAWGTWQVSKVAENTASYSCGIPPVSIDPISQLTLAWNEFLIGLKNWICQNLGICL